MHKIEHCSVSAVKILMFMIYPGNKKESDLRICVLQPDYSTTNVDYQHYDPPRDLAHLLPDATIHHVTINKLTAYSQLKSIKKQGYDVLVNLCEGYLEWEVPSIDLIYFMELLGLPFTGPTSLLYDPSKELMKYVAYTEGVKTPSYALIENESTLDTDCSHLKFPLFVKPAKAGDSLGIDEHSLVINMDGLKNKVYNIIDEYGPLLVEEYIAGREFTVMLAADAKDEKLVKTFQPVEYIFSGNDRFKTYALKTSELHPDANIPVTDPLLDQKLRSAAESIFRGFNGVGYARLDFRMADNGDLFFLEINFTCSVFYKDGYEGSADYILKHDGFGQANFLRHIIAEGMSRYKRKHKMYRMKGNAIAGYGIYTTRDIAAGEIIFKGEEAPQRIVTKRFVNNNWPPKEKDTFRKYAYPVSSEVFLLWDNDPSGWAPQNHSCNPNTAYEGLNVVALRAIKNGEELSLNYANFLDEHMEPFECKCGSTSCNGFIKGVVGNSVTLRETNQNFTVSI